MTPASSTLSAGSRTSTGTRSPGTDLASAAHGSREARRLGVHDNYLFAGWDEPQPGFPRTDVQWKRDPARYGLEYEAYHLGVDRYRSDSAFDERGRRWHPDDLDPRLLDSARRSVVLVHPCHWDASPAAKARRLGGKGRDEAARSDAPRDCKRRRLSLGVVARLGELPCSDA